MKMSSDFYREVLNFVKIGSQKCWVYDTSQKKVVERLGVLTCMALKYCILRRPFSEMFDSLARITCLGGLRTRARTDTTGFAVGLPWPLVLETGPGSDTTGFAVGLPWPLCPIWVLG